MKGTHNYILGILMAILAAVGSVTQYHHHGCGDTVCLCLKISRHTGHHDEHRHTDESACHVRALPNISTDISLREDIVPTAAAITLIADMAPVSDMRLTSVSYRPCGICIYDGYDPPDASLPAHRGPPSEESRLV